MGRLIGRFATLVVLAIGSTWLLPQLAAFLHLGIGSAVCAFILIAMSSNSIKSRDNASRIDGVVQKVGSLNGTVTGLQSQRGTFSGFSGTNTSFSMGGGFQVTSTSGSSNNGGFSSQTSGQIGGAAAHVHDMTHLHTDSTDLQNIFNQLQSSFSTVDARCQQMFNALQAAGIL